jgi:hypothetical protein
MTKKYKNFCLLNFLSDLLFQQRKQKYIIDKYLDSYMFYLFITK